MNYYHMWDLAMSEKRMIHNHWSWYLATIYWRNIKHKIKILIFDRWNENVILTLYLECDGALLKWSCVPKPQITHSMLVEPFGLYPPTYFWPSTRSAFKVFLITASLYQQLPQPWAKRAMSRRSHHWLIDINFWAYLQPIKILILDLIKI